MSPKIQNASMFWTPPITYLKLWELEMFQMTKCLRLCVRIPLQEISFSSQYMIYKSPLNGYDWMWYRRISLTDWLQNICCSVIKSIVYVGNIWRCNIHVDRSAWYKNWLCVYWIYLMYEVGISTKLCWVWLLASNKGFKAVYFAMTVTRFRHIHI